MRHHSFSCHFPPKLCFLPPHPLQWAEFKSMGLILTSSCGLLEFYKVGQQLHNQRINVSTVITFAAVVLILSNLLMVDSITGFTTLFCGLQVALGQHIWDLIALIVRWGREVYNEIMSRNEWWEIRQLLLPASHWKIMKKHIFLVATCKMNFSEHCHEWINFSQIVCIKLHYPQKVTLKSQLTVHQKDSTWMPLLSKWAGSCWKIVLFNTVFMHSWFINGKESLKGKDIQNGNEKEWMKSICKVHCAQK